MTTSTTAPTVDSMLATLRDGGVVDATAIYVDGRWTASAGTGRIETSQGGASSGSVARADVALVVAETLARPGLAGATVEFNNGEVPVDEALAAYER